MARLDLQPPVVPAAQDNFDLALAVNVFTPGNLSIEDIPPVPVFDRRRGRVSNPKDRRVVSMPPPSSRSEHLVSDKSKRSQDDFSLAMKALPQPPSLAPQKNAVQVPRNHQTFNLHSGFSKLSLIEEHQENCEDLGGVDKHTMFQKALPSPKLSSEEYTSLRPEVPQIQPRETFHKHMESLPPVPPAHNAFANLNTAFKFPWDGLLGRDSTVVLSASRDELLVGKAVDSSSSAGPLQYKPTNQNFRELEDYINSYFQRSSDSVASVDSPTIHSFALPDAVSLSSEYSEHDSLPSSEDSLFAESTRNLHKRQSSDRTVESVHHLHEVAEVPSASMKQPQLGNKYKSLPDNAGSAVLPKQRKRASHSSSEHSTYGSRSNADFCLDLGTDYDKSRFMIPREQRVFSEAHKQYKAHLKAQKKVMASETRNVSEPVDIFQSKKLPLPPAHTSEGDFFKRHSFFGHPRSVTGPLYKVKRFSLR